MNNNIDNSIQQVAKTQHGRKNAIRKYRKHSIHSNNYSEELTDRICELVSNGESITKICKRKALPSVFTLYNWMDVYPEFKNKYQQARARKAHLLVEKAEDQPLAALAEVRSMDVSDKRCNAIVQAHRLAVDTNLKVAGLYNREEYGNIDSKPAITAIGIHLQMGDTAAVRTVPDNEVAVDNKKLN